MSFTSQEALAHARQARTAWLRNNLDLSALRFWFSEVTAENLKRWAREFTVPGPGEVNEIERLYGARVLVSDRPYADERYNPRTDVVIG